METGLRRTGAVGGKYIVLPGFSVGPTLAELQEYCDYFNRIGKIAAEYGLMLGYHNHSGEYNKLKDSDKVMWEYLVENTDPRYVCFELDVYWCTKGGKNPVEYLKKYPKRIKMLHVKDDFVIGESGDIDFESIFKQFYKNGMKDYVVEIETPGSASQREERRRQQAHAGADHGARIRRRAQERRLSLRRKIR